MEAKDYGQICGGKSVWELCVNSIRDLLLGRPSSSHWEVLDSWEVSWVAWSLRYRFPEADPKMRIHVQVILKDMSPGEQDKEPGQGMAGSQARVSSQAKSQRRRGLWRIHCLLQFFPAHPGKAAAL